MLIASGTLLVLLTWTVALVAIISVGILPARAIGAGRQGNGHPSRATLIRHAMWWGLLVVTLFTYVANILQPLHSAPTALAGVLLVLLLGTPGWRYLLNLRVRGQRLSSGWPLTVLWIALAFSLVYLAVAALGPVTNYDSGLYHLGAVRYAADFPTVPGLANLFFALGYGNAEFPLAALLGNGPWQAEGYRLLNGLVMAMAVVDLYLRSRERARGPGLYVLAVGLLAAWVPLVALSDYWVTSPTQDSFVFVATVVATAYLADAASGSNRWLASGATTMILGTVLVLLRPTMAAFAGGSLLVVVLLAIHRRASIKVDRAGSVFIAIGIATLGAAAAATARDYLLSGWLQYPLSVYAFDVPWLAEDPIGSRQATLGYHRNPQDLWGAVEGWAWLGPWLTNRVAQWETYELAGLALTALILVLIASRAGRPAVRWRAMGVALLPSAVASAFWFVVTPPSYRFAWGPLFTLATIPIGWALWTLANETSRSRLRASAWTSVTFLGVALPILAVTLYSSAARLDVDAMTAEREWVLGISIPYVVAPVIDVPVVRFAATGGLTLLQPTESDQCWWNYPLCTPQPNPGLRLQGDGLTSGFAR